MVPRAQMEVRAPSPDQVDDLEGLVGGQVQKVPGHADDFEDHNGPQYLQDSAALSERHR